MRFFLKNNLKIYIFLQILIYVFESPESACSCTLFKSTLHVSSSAIPTRPHAYETHTHIYKDTCAIRLASFRGCAPRGSCVRERLLQRRLGSERLLPRRRASYTPGCAHIYAESYIHVLFFIGRCLHRASLCACICKRSCSNPKAFAGRSPGLAMASASQQKTQGVKRGATSEAVVVCDECNQAIGLHEKWSSRGDFKHGYCRWCQARCCSKCLSYDYLCTSCQVWRLSDFFARCCKVADSPAATLNTKEEASASQ